MLLTLFGTGRITKHQFMRNFAISLWLPYIIVLLGGFLITIIAGLYLIAIGHSAGEFKPALESLASYLGIASVVLSVVINIFTALQRFHDFGKPGIRALLLFVPIYNLYLVYVLATTDSVKSENEFGPVPAVTLLIKNRSSGSLVYRYSFL